MPGWHEKTKQLQEAGKVKMVGIVQEQHPERTRLFMQWKKMGWPILADPLNLLGVEVVPITLLIDEHGIIRTVRPADEDFEKFLATQYDPAQKMPTAGRKDPPDLAKLARAARENDPEVWRAYGDALVLWGRPARLEEAIAFYQKALGSKLDEAPTHFRLGVAHRKRFDSEGRQEGDFANAVLHWSRALELNPNQYIWRRRIQQYGPRLEKPYSFYDWVLTAREEIKARGEEPTALSIEPAGAEFAHPLKAFQESQLPEREPDLQGQILRDTEGFIQVESAVVPPAIKAGEAVRVHVVFRPNKKIKAHWNNEVDDLVFWIHPPQGWQADNRQVSVRRPPQPVSIEVRNVEFELKSPGNFKGSISVPAYALYYVCEDVNGTCLYRRQDMTVTVAAKGE